MAHNEDRIIRTDKSMIQIYDKFKSDFSKTHGIELSYPDISKKIAEKIISVGGVIA